MIRIERERYICLEKRYNVRAMIIFKLILADWCECPKLCPVFLTPHAMDLSVLNGFRWKVIVRFLEYWWNCWPSLFKLSFSLENIGFTNDLGYVPFVVSTSRFFPHSWFITGFVTRLTRQMSLVKQELYLSGAHEFTPGF